VYEGSMTDVFDGSRTATAEEPAERFDSFGAQLVSDPETRYEPFPLTDVQRAYWLGRSGYFDLGNVACHVYFEFDISRIDRSRLAAGWQRLIDRHDMLRAVIRKDGLQQVLPHTPHYEIKHLDLRAAGRDAVQSGLKTIRDRMSHQIFATDRWPLFDLRTTDLGDRTVLHFSLDLLFVDLWSLQLLFDEWAQLTLDSDAYLAPLEITFRDCVLAATQDRLTDAYRRAEAYWLRRIEKLPPAPRLPLAKTPSALANPIFVRREAVLAKAMWRKIKARSMKSRLTPSGVLMAAFARVLAAWSQDRRFTLNTTVFQRPPLHPDVYRLVGDFTSIVLVEVNVEAAEPFEALARRIAAQFRRDLEHREYSGLQLLQELTKRGDPDRPPAMPVVFTSALAQSMPGWQSAEAVGELTYGITQTPQVYLDHQVYERGGDVHLTWDTVEELFPAGMLDEMFNAYVSDLRRLGEDDSAWTEPTTPVPPVRAEQQKAETPAVAAAQGGRSLPAEVTGPRAPRPITSRLSDKAAAALRRHAFVDDAIVYQLEDSSLIAFARGSKDHVLPAPDAAPWAKARLFTPTIVRSADEAAPDLADFLHELESLERLSTQFMMETFRAVGVFDHGGELWTTEGIVQHGAIEPKYAGLIARWLHILAADRVLVTHDQVHYAAAASQAARNSTQLPSAPVEGSLTAYFREVTRNLVPLLRGEADPLSFLFPAGDWRIAEMLYQQNPLSRRINALAAEVVRKLADATSGAIRVLEVGGGIGSVTNFLLPVLPPDRTRYLLTDITSFFQPGAKRKFADFPFVEYGILDALQDPLAQGLLPYSFDLIVASNVMHNASDPALALARLRRLLKPGGLILLIEATRNTRVHAVTIGFIEGLINLGHDTERPFLPLARWVGALQASGFDAIETEHDQTGPTSDLGVDLIFARAPAPTPAEREDAAAHVKNGLTGSGLENFLRWHLATEELPHEIVMLDKFPRASDGNIDPAALLRLRRQQPAREAPSKSTTEAVIGKIWAAAVGRDGIGVNENFLEAGGDSLIAVRIVATIREQFDIELRAQDFLVASTIRLMAAEVERRRSEQTDDSAPTELPSIVPDPDNRREAFPLTDIQEAYWIGRLGAFELGNVGSHYYLELDAGALDRDRLEAAWQQLIERHGMLRTAVLAEGQQQLIDPAPRYRIELSNLAGRSEAERERALTRERARMSHRSYSGEHWPPFELRLTRIAPTRTRIHMSLDLLMLDLWSARLLMRELLALYEEPNLALPPLEIGFREYVLAIREFEKSERWTRSLQYWMQRLPTLPPAPGLPLARDPATIKQPHFVRRAGTLTAPEWERVKTDAQANGLTASSVLLAAFSAVLAKWSRHQQFTINLTLFQRLPLHPQVNQIVGDFTSTILLAVDCGRAATLVDLAREAQGQLWRDLEHHYVSGVRVIRELARIRETGPRPSMPIVFTSGLAQGMPELERLERMQGPGFGEIVHSISQTPQVWLDHQVYEQAGALLFNWDAVEELFPPELLDDMFAEYAALVQRLARDGMQSIELGTNGAAWSRADEQPVADVSPTAASLGLLHGPFLEQVSKAPTRAAIVSLDRRLSYQDLYRRARTLARRLHQMGAGRDKLVAIVMEKGWEQIVAAVAVLEAGAAYLPIDPDLPQERIWLLLRRGGADIVVTQPCVRDRLTLPQETTCVAVEWELGEPDPTLDSWQPPRARGEDLAYVIFTSGSTGEPKGVMIEHQSALNTILDINERFAVGADDRILALSSLSFDLSVYDIFGALAAGAAIVIPHPSSAREPGDWASLVLHERVTIWNSVPALLDMLVDHVGERKELLGASLRLALLSGDWIPVKLPDRARTLIPGLQVISLGGATEASIWSIFYPIGRVAEDWTSIPYGRALSRQETVVLNDIMQPCPMWVTGEIYIGGVGVARGYWRDEEKTNARFVLHPQTGKRLYRTGDLGRYLPSGDIEFLGREDDQVKIQGFRIELGEIEAALARHPDVRAAVVNVSGQRTGPRHLVAYVVGDAISFDALKEHLRERLPSYMVPNVWRQLDQLPLTANGKINRKALPDEAARAHVHTPAPAGDSETLATVTALVSAQLNLPSLDPAQNLLALGATSIDLVQTVARLEKEFGFRPSFPEFFREPTVAALARLIDERRNGAGAAAAPAAAPHRRSFELIVEPQAREAFRRERHSIRAFAGEQGKLPLPREELDAASSRFQTRRAIRNFLPEPVSLAALGGWLAEISRAAIGETFKQAYGSAGGYYPVQTYLHIKEHGVEGCPSGTFYYHPADHALVPLTLGAELDGAVHEPFTNRPIFEQARFSVFFVNQPAANEPMYGDIALRFSMLEAGAMAQVLETSASRFQLGVCPVGWIDFDAIRGLLHLDEGQELLHSHVGGLAAPSAYSGDWEEGSV
jgi:amino acid adenylation domain-containing protein